MTAFARVAYTQRTHNGDDRPTVVLDNASIHNGDDRPTVVLDNAPTHNGDDRPTVILDNAPTHNGIMEVYPNLEFKYLPAYSIPIEHCFSVFKTYPKQYLHSEALQCPTANAQRLGITVQTLRERTLEKELN